MIRDSDVSPSCGDFEWQGGGISTLRGAGKLPRGKTIGAGRRVYRSQTVQTAI